MTKNTPKKIQILVINPFNPSEYIPRVFPTDGYYIVSFRKRETPEGQGKWVHIVEEHITDKTRHEYDKFAKDVEVEW